MVYIYAGHEMFGVKSSVIVTDFPGQRETQSLQFVNYKVNSIRFALIPAKIQNDFWRSAAGWF